jgi:hypothetical protein
LLLAAFSSPLATLLLIIYPAQVLRHAIQDRFRVGGSLWRRIQVSALLMLTNFAVAQGCAEFGFKHILGLKKNAILYK